MTWNLSSNKLFVKNMFFTQKVSWHLGGVNPRPDTYGIQRRCPNLPSPLIGTLVSRSSSSATPFNTGIGGASLVDLHNQILTLKEIIMSLESIIKEGSNSKPSEPKIANDPRSGDPKGSLIEAEGCISEESPEGVVFATEDFMKLQEEYNKLIFKKHQV
jgi:hypothetical protein